MRLRNYSSSEPCRIPRSTRFTLASASRYPTIALALITWYNLLLLSHYILNLLHKKQLLVLHKAHVAFRELEVKRFGPVDEEGYPLDPKDQPQYSAEELYADFMREQACVKFLGEMYKLNVFSREDFLKTVFFLMEDPTDEIAIELCCTILKTAGKHFEEDMGDTLTSPEDEDSPDIVETAFGILETYASQDTMSGRLRGIITVNIYLLFISLFLSHFHYHFENNRNCWNSKQAIGPDPHQRLFDGLPSVSDAI
mgnify:FL=1